MSTLTTKEFREWPPFLLVIKETPPAFPTACPSGIPPLLSGKRGFLLGLAFLVVSKTSHNQYCFDGLIDMMICWQKRTRHDMARARYPLAIGSGSELGVHENNARQTRISQPSANDRPICSTQGGLGEWSSPLCTVTWTKTQPNIFSFGSNMQWRFLFRLVETVMIGPTKSRATLTFQLP